MTSQSKQRRVYKFSKKANSFAAEISILSFHFASREDLSKSETRGSRFPLRTNSLFLKICKHVVALIGLS